MNLADKLLKEGIKPKHHGIGNQKIKCPQCQPENHNPRDNPLSLTIKSDTAVWFCHHCEFKGSWTESYGIYRPKKEKKIYVKPTVAKKQYNDFLYQYFAERKINKTAVDQLKIYNDGQWIAFPYFDKESQIANIKFRTTDKKFKQSPNTKPTLYNYDNIYQSDTVIFCEGEVDVLSCAEVGYKNATTLPNGAPKEAKFNDNDARFAPLEHCPLVAKKIILFTDNDESGRALHKELLHRFGKDLCWYVSLPEGCKDANEVLVKHGPMKLKDIIDEAEPYPVDGLYTAHDYWNQVNDLYEGKYIKALEVGLDGLDDIYKLLPSTFHVVTGIPNHGKSLFLDQILINVARNHKWRFAIFSPEHSTSMHIRRLVQMYIRKPFDEEMHGRMTKEELARGLQFVHDHFFFIEAKDSVPTIDYILNVAKSACFKYGIKGLVIDPYNEVDAKRTGGAREDEHIRDFISLCKRFTRLHDLVLWVVAHPTKLPKTDKGGYAPPTAYDISGAAHWHNQSDAVLTVHRDFDENTTKVITRKIREQDIYGKIGEVKFTYNFRTRQYEPFTMAEDWQDISFD